MSCKKSFGPTAGFSWYPNGVIVHIECAKNRNVCPVTGEVFRADKGSS